MPQAAELRRKLNEAGARFRVVKNTLTRARGRQGRRRGAQGGPRGPTAFTFVAAEGGDVALAAKALASSGARHDLLEFKGGVMDGEALTAEQIEALSRLPARDVLHGQLVGDDRVADHRPGPRPERADRRAGDPAGQIARQGLVPAGEAPAAEPEAPAEEAPRPPAAEEAPPREEAAGAGRGGPAEEPAAEEAAAEEASAGD